jgi:MFS family permease
MLYLGAYAWGKLTDSIDRRIVILIATVLYGVAMYLSCIITNNWLQYIVAFLFGLADSCFNVLYIGTVPYILIEFEEELSKRV